jgi:hypothetical protein
VTELSARSHGWRVALRLAARSARLTIGRTLLVGALIALPVAGVSALATVYASAQETVGERVDYTLGNTGTALQVVMPTGSDLYQNPEDMEWYGATDADSDSEQPETWIADIADVVPAGTRVLRVQGGTATARTATGIGSFDTAIGDTSDPSLEGRYTLLDGRRAASDDEALVSPTALDRLGISLGGILHIEVPVAADFTVVGTMHSATQPDNLDQLFLPASYAPVPEFPDYESSVTFYLPEVALTWDDVLAANKLGVVALSRTVALDPPLDAIPSDLNDGTSNVLLLGAIILVFALLEVGLLAAAAFMVGARQQQRTLAILASVGADSRTVARVVSFSGIVTGVASAVVGVTAGIGGAALVMALTGDGSATQYPGFHIEPVWLAGIAGIAIVVSWIAALVPARLASRADIVAALRGAVRPAQPRKRTPVIAIIVFLLGIAATVAGIVVLRASAGYREQYYSSGEVSESDWSLSVSTNNLGVGLLSAGPVVAQIAAIIIAPAIFRMLARALSRISVGTRLASRDAARHASRTVPAASVVMSTVFLSAFTVCLLAGGQQGTNDSYQYAFAPEQVGIRLVAWDGDSAPVLPDNPDRYADALRSSFDVGDARVLSTVADTDEHSVLVRRAPRWQCPWDLFSTNYDPQATYEQGAECDTAPMFARAFPSPYPEKIWVGDEADLALMLDEKPSSEALETLAGGGVVSFYPHFVDDGTVVLDWWPLVDGEPVDLEDGEPSRTETLSASYEPTPHPGAFALFMSPETARRLDLITGDTLALASTNSTPTQAQEDAAIQAISALSNGVLYPQVERGPTQFVQWQWGVLVISTIIMLAASAVAVGLARSDGRRDDAVLGAVGASPGLRRSFGFWQAIIICFTGALVGAALGFAEFAALAGGSLVGITFALPWVPLVALVVGVPLLIAIGAWLTARPGRTHVMDRSAIA